MDLKYGGYCNNPDCSTISVGASTDPKCRCGWEWSDTPGKEMKKRTCAEVAKELVNRSGWFGTDGFVDWAKEFKACSDFPREPEVHEWIVETGKEGWFESIFDRTLGAKHAKKKYKVVLTEIIE